MSSKKAPENTPVKTRKKAERRYQISWDALQKMDISPAAKEEMITRGVAQPDPFTRRLEGLDPDLQQGLRNIQATIEKFNEIDGRVQVRIQIVKHGEPEPESASE